MTTPSQRRWRSWRKTLQTLEPGSHEVTAQSAVINRRAFSSALTMAGLSLASLPSRAVTCSPLVGEWAVADEAVTDRSLATSYNNYSEFSPDKKAVRFLAKELTTSPWTLRIEGEVAKPLTLDLDDIRRHADTEERVYRFRCVEGWSMVVPWSGVALCRLLEAAAPTSRAKYVQFVSLERPSEMIGQRRGTLPWPYQEALRIDEAVHPLTLLATGMYGDALPPQNGGPVRLVVPWKYGFKSAKALTRIVLTETQPTTTWPTKAPSEYGFFGNVNPEVPHPRWSQARENRLGELRKRPTLMLNGYADSVAALYVGLDPTTLY